MFSLVFPKLLIIKEIMALLNIKIFIMFLKTLLLLLIEFYLEISTYLLLNEKIIF